MFIDARLYFGWNFCADSDSSSVRPMRAIRLSTLSCWAAKARGAATTATAVAPVSRNWRRVERMMQNSTSAGGCRARRESRAWARRGVDADQSNWRSARIDVSIPRFGEEEQGNEEADRRDAHRVPQPRVQVAGCCHDGKGDRRQEAAEPADAQMIGQR